MNRLRNLLPAMITIVLVSILAARAAASLALESRPPETTIAQSHVGDEDGYIEIGGVSIALGDTWDDVREALGEADRIDATPYGFDWHVYNSDYSRFVMVGIGGGVVKGLYSNAGGFSTGWGGYGDARHLPETPGVTFYYDRLNGNAVYACLILSDDGRGLDMNTEYLFRAQELENIDAVNAFRVNHGLGTLELDELAMHTARAHSVDMAEHNYFSHQSRDGLRSYERYERNGGAYIRYGENIAAGYALGIDSFDGWVNSEGHRNNILGDFEYIGVGFGYKGESDYKYYMTQNFVSRAAGTGGS